MHAIQICMSLRKALGKAIILQLIIFGLMIFWLKISFRLLIARAIQPPLFTPVLFPHIDYNRTLCIGSPKQLIQILMECYCSSKRLYSQAQENRSFLFDSKESSSRRLIKQKPPLTTFQQSTLNQLKELSELWVNQTVPEIQFQEIRYHPLHFYKNFVGRNTPCLIKGCMDGKETIERWRDYSYLKEVMGGNQFTVAVTPDGFADSVKRDCFIEPLQMHMTMASFLKFRDEHQGIEYIQGQNNNMNSQFNILQYEFPSQSIKFIGDSLFEKQPDAVNFWMGRSESVSAIHKDPYQNLYQVVNGQKHFTLVPPIDVMHLPEHEYFSSRWQLKDGEFNVKTTKDVVKWVSSNPDLISDYKQFKEMAGMRLMHVVVGEGDMLYLPSLWYHQVSQHNKNSKQYTIAVNYWFDMEFNQNHSLYELTRLLSGL